MRKALVGGRWKAGRNRRGDNVILWPLKVTLDRSWLTMGSILVEISVSLWKVVGSCGKLWEIVGSWWEVGGSSRNVGCFSTLSFSWTHLHRIRIMHDCVPSTLTHKNVAGPCFRVLVHRTISSMGCLRRQRPKRLCRARAAEDGAG